MKSSVYEGKPQENGFSAVICENNVMGIVAIYDGYTHELGEQLMELITEQFSTEPGSLSHFESCLSDLIHKGNVPIDFSIALGVRKENGIYLKTFGTGMILLVRKNIITPLISGNNIASGMLERNDILVFSTEFFLTTLKGQSHLHKLLAHRTSTEQIGSRIKVGMEGVDDSGAVALFVEPHAIDRSGSFQRQESGTPAMKQSINAFFQAFHRTHVPLKKILILGVVLLAVCGIIVNTFLWKKNAGSSTSISSPIGQAQAAVTRAESADDLVTATGILNTVRSQIRDGSASGRDVTQKQKTELSQALALLDEAEKKLLNIAEQKASVYYDFSLEEKNVTGTQMTISGGKMVVSDTAGRVFTVVMDGKSVEVVSNAKLKGATLMGAEDDVAYLLTASDGIYKVDGKEIKQAVKPDDLWLKLTQLQVYNGNIYLLDTGNNALYKYAGYDGGWGGRQSYFKGTYDDLSESMSFSIRVSIYVVGKSGVTKYTSGVKDDFSLQYPSESVIPSGILTPAEETDIYVWDKSTGSVLIFGEKGEYKKQIRSEGLKKAADVEVADGAIYYLAGGLIYSLPL